MESYSTPIAFKEMQRNASQRVATRRFVATQVEQKGDCIGVIFAQSGLSNFLGALQTFPRRAASHETAANPKNTVEFNNAFEFVEFSDFVAPPVGIPPCF